MKFKTQAVVVKMIRTKLELTQTEMGNILGVGGQVISNAERGMMQLPLKRLRKLNMNDSQTEMYIRARLHDVEVSLKKALISKKN